MDLERSSVFLAGFYHVQKFLVRWDLGYLYWLGESCSGIPKESAKKGFPEMYVLSNL